MVLAMLRLACLAVLFVTLGHGACAQESASSSRLNAADLAFIDRLTWGVNASTAADFQALGRDRWLDRQLHPGPKDRLPAAAEAQIAAMQITTQPVTSIVASAWTQQRALGQITDPEQKKVAERIQNEVQLRPWKETVTRSLLRDLYSADQLREKMTWFWLNHFNVYAFKGDVRHTIGDYEDTLRRYAFARFRDLLGAIATEPAMLRYLDNTENARGRLNENYAREIMELHTMGVGSGYSQGDVQELARILTGIGIMKYPTWNPPDPREKTSVAVQRGFVRNGLFEFNPDRHDYLAKRFLGHSIDQSGLAEFGQALDMMAANPATARYVSRKISIFFVSDTPPDALVERMAQTFKATDGDIASVLLVMFKSPEFDDAIRAKEKFKDPMQFVLSALRLGYDTEVVLNTNPIESWLSRLGQGLYNHQTPEGYPMTASYWNASGQLTMRFEIARQLGSNAGLFRSPGPNAADRQVAPQIQNAFYINSIQPTLSAPTRAVLDQVKSPREWNALFLSSPDFMHY